MLGLRKRNRRKLPQEKQRFPFVRWPNGTWKKIASFAMFWGFALTFGYGLVWALARPIRVVAVEGRFQRVSPVQVEQAVTRGLEAGLMSVDLETVQRNVETLPWVDRARVQRRWPNGLRVEVTEQIAAARW